jgi:RecQ-mediated genome instability protein 1
MEILSRERILSPIGRGTHFPSSPSPPPPQTAHFPGTRPIAHLPKRSISNPKTNSKTTAAKDRAPSSDFDYDFGMDDMAMVMDDAALEELDLIEVKASGSNFVSNSTNSNISVLGSSVSGGGSAYASAVGSGSGFGAPSTSISIPPPIQREPTRNVDSNIIVIDSDAEEDKENVPVPTRHVRRRTQQDMTQARGQPRARLDVDVDDDDVIDISSE